MDKIEQDKEREKTCSIPGIKIELIFSTRVFDLMKPVNFVK